MKFSIQIKFIATLFLILISINHLNGLPAVNRRRTVREIETVADDAAAAAATVSVATAAEEEVTNQSVVVVVTDGSANSTTSTTVAPRVRMRDKNSKFQKPEPYEPPEKTWKALQICGIITFFVIVLYYLKKITKKFERNHDQDL